MLVTFADEWFTYFPAGLSVSITDDLGLTYAQFGTVMASLFAGGVLGLVFTIAADYVDRRRLAAFGAFSYGAAMLVFGFADSFALMVAAGFVWGAASDAFISATDVTLIELSRDDLPRMLSRQNALSSIGDVLGPVSIAAFAWAGVSWRYLFAGAGALMVLYGFWILALKFPEGTAEDDDEEEAAPIRTVLGLFRDPLLMRLAFIFLLFSLLDEPFAGFLILRMERELHLGAELASICVGVLVAAGILGHLLVPPIVARMPLRRAMMICCALCAAGVAMLAEVDHYALLLFGAVLLGLFGATFFSLLESALYALRPGQAGATSAATSIIGFLAMVFPSFVGSISQQYGLSQGLSAYAIAALVMLILSCYDARLR